MRTCGWGDFGLGCSRCTALGVTFPAELHAHVLAEKLTRLLDSRRGQESFKLLVITRDEENMNARAARAGAPAAHAQTAKEDDRARA